MIPAKAFPVVTIPDQRALIGFENGTEHLVIETSFTSAGTNFAWIVPVPSVPEIKAVSADMFSNLESVFRPALVHTVSRLYLAFLVLAVSFHLARKGILDESTFLADLPVCLGISILIGVMMKSLVLAVVVLFFSILLRSVRSKETLGATAVFYLFIFGASMLFRPLTASLVMTMGDSEGQEEAQVNVIERKTVGVYETATLTAKTPDALFAWLSENGFATNRKFLPTLKEYIQENWVFVAAKVRRDSPAQAKSSPTPLAFTFKTDKPVYPLRLTGIGNPSCAIELYVFGPHRAKLSHFKVEHCEETQRGNIGGPFQPWAGSAPVFTKLSGKLSSRSMNEDAYFKWVSFSAKRTVLFSFSAATTITLNIAIAVGAFGGILISLSSGGWGTTDANLRGWYLKLFGVVLAVAALTFLLLPKTKIYFLD